MNEETPRDPTRRPASDLDHRTDVRFEIIERRVDSDRLIAELRERLGIVDRLIVLRLLTGATKTAIAAKFGISRQKLYREIARLKREHPDLFGE